MPLFGNTKFPYPIFNTKLSFQFLDDIDPIFKILRIYQNDQQDLFVPTFSNIFNISYFQRLILPKILFSNIGLSSWIISSVLMSPKISNIGFGSRGHIKQARKKHKNHEMLGFPKIKPTSYWTKKNNYTKLLGNSFHNITIKMSPRPPSQIRYFFPDVPGFSIGNMPVFGLW